MSETMTPRFTVTERTIVRVWRELPPCEDGRRRQVLVSQYSTEEAELTSARALGGVAVFSGADLPLA